MKTAIAKIVGTPSDKAWSQVHNFTPLEEEKKVQRGALLAVLSIKEESEGIGSVEAGREILARLHEEYFGHEKESPFEQLKSAVRVVSKEFSPLDLGIIASVVWKNYIYFCILGSGSVFIWRDGKLTQLLAGVEQSAVSLSGTPQNEDVFILGTNAFFEIASTASLKELLLSKKTLQEVADNLIPLIHQGNSASSTAVFVKTGEESIEGEEKTSRFKIAMPGFLKSAITSLLLRIPERQISVQRDGSGSKRTMVSVGVILLLLLGVSIFFGLRQKNVLIYRSSYEDRLVSAQNAYSDSLLQKDVDSTRSRELFLQAKNTSFSLKNEGIKDSRLDELIVKLENDTAMILGIVASKASVFLDLSLVRSGVTAGELSLHGGSLAIMDREGKRLFSLSVQGKETEVLAGQEKLGSPRTIALYSGRYFSLGDKGIIEVDSKGNAKTAVALDEEWGDVVKIGVFGGNLYLIDRKGQIWRYQASEKTLPAGRQGFGSKQKWLGPGVTPDFSDTVDMAIDGSIWLLSSNGKVSKFTRGSPEGFSISGLEEGFGEPIALYTDENLESVYVLDKGKGRIVQLGKKSLPAGRQGEYQKQYVAEEIKTALDFVVSKTAGKIFLLTDIKVLEINLE